jgi:GMP synthase-like glutamine amidotransferase
MRIQCIQHVFHEDMGSIKPWITQKGYDLQVTKMFNNESLPDTFDFDWLIILGGPMGAYEESRYPWLVEEKRFIEKCIRSDKKVLGICLGSQLIADVLGGKVFKGRFKEIGWQTVSLTQAGKKSKLFTDFSELETVFQWHGDTFDLPDKAVHLIKSDVCQNQAFSYGDNVLALQFHLEFTPIIVEQLIITSGDEITDEPHIQHPDDMLNNLNNFTHNHMLMKNLLNNFEKAKV